MINVNEQVVAEFRARAGVVVEAMGGHFKDIQLLPLHTTGRRSGRHYVTPVVYIEDGDRYIVADAAYADNYADESSMARTVPA